MSTFPPPLPPDDIVPVDPPDDSWMVTPPDDPLDPPVVER